MKRNHLLLLIVLCAFTGIAFGWWGSRGAQIDVGLTIGLLVGGWIAWPIIALQRGQNIQKKLPGIIVGHGLSIAMIIIALSQGVVGGFFIGLSVGIFFAIITMSFPDRFI